MKFKLKNLDREILFTKIKNILKCSINQYSSESSFIAFPK